MHCLRRSSAAALVALAATLAASTAQAAPYLSITQAENTLQSELWELDDATLAADYQFAESYPTSCRRLSRSSVDCRYESIVAIDHEWMRCRSAARVRWVGRWATTDFRHFGCIDIRRPEWTKP